MDTYPTIRSRANPLLKRVGALLAGKERDALVLEGDRLVHDALGAGLRPELVLLSEERLDEADRFAARAGAVRLVEPELLARVSGLKSSPGILAVCPLPAPLGEAGLRRALERSDALALVVAGVADPGNLGALARSAEAAGAGVLAVLPGGASPWSPKALRGSMGSLLRLPVYTGGAPSELARALAELHVRGVCAATRGGAAPDAFDWSGRVALWVGGETGALPELAPPPAPLTIPTAGAVESLNVTVAASLLLFAAGRVRAGVGGSR